MNRWLVRFYGVLIFLVLGQGCGWTQINGVNDNIVSANLNNSGSLSLGSISGLGGDLTIEGWVYLSSYANWGRIADLGSGENNNNILLTTVGTTGKPGFSVRSGSTELGFIQGSTALGLNTWVHVAGVIQSDRTMRLYINGTQVAAGNATGDVPIVTRTSNYIGKSNWSADSLLNGAVADVRIWNTARTQTEIQNNMNVGSITGPTTGLVAGYTFGATGATPLADISGNGYTATQSGDITYSKFDTGTLTIGGFSGSTTSLNVNQGTLDLTGVNSVKNITVNNAGVTQSSGSLTTTQTADSFKVGASSGDNGTYALSGGTVTVGANANAFIGAAGIGTMNQTGGTFTGTEWVVVGRFSGGSGTYNISGGTLSQNDAATKLIIGEETAGTLNVSGTGVVDSAGGLSLSHTSGGVGTVNLNGGTILAPSVAKGSGGTATINFNGGTLKATGNNTNFMSGLNTAALLAGGGTIDDGGYSITVSQVLSSTGNFTKTGAGMLTLTGNNTYSGTTTVETGSLRIGANGTSGTLGTGPVVTKGTLIFDRGDSFAVSSAISGSGEVKKWGYGTTTFTGSNTFTGDFTHNFGVTVLNRTGGSALYANGATGNVVIANLAGGATGWYGAVEMGAANQLGTNVNVTFSPQNITSGYSYLVLKGNNTVVGNLSSTANFGSAWGIIENAEGGFAGMAAGRLTVTQTTNGTFTGEFRDGNWNGGGNLGLTKNGAATLTLADAGGIGISYTGSTLVNAGRLVIASTNFNSAATVASGATFEVSTGVDQTLKAGVVVSGNGTFAKSGAAKLTLNSVNSQTGGLVVNGGTLQFTNDNQLGAAGGGITLNGGALYNLDSVTTVSSNRTVTLGTNGGYVISGWSKTTTLAGTVTGQGGLGIGFDSGTVMLSGSNNYAGATTVGTTASPFYWVNNGANPTLRLGSSNALPTGNALVFGASANNNTATLDLNGFSASVGGMTAGGNAVIDNSAAGTAALSMAPATGTNTFGGIIKNTAGAVSVTKSGAGTQILTGANTYSGTTVVSDGTLQIGSGGGAGSLGSGAVINNSTLAFNRNNPMTVGNSISGTGTVIQNGLDAVTLTGSNTFTGDYLHRSGVTVLNRTNGPALYAGGTGGNVVIGNAVGGNTYFYSAVEMGAANQLGTNVNVTFAMQNIPMGLAYLTLRGNDTVIGNLNSTANFGGAWGIVENQEAGSFGNSRLTVTQTTNGSFTGEIRNGFGTSVGSLGLTKNGSATLTLVDPGVGASGIAYTGSTVVNSGRLVARDTTRFASTVTVNSNGVFAVDTGSTMTWSNAVAGSGGLAKQGGGTVTLTAQTTHTGGSVVEAGTLVLSGNNRLATNGSVTVQSGGTLRLGGDQTLASLAGSGAVTFASNSTGYYLKVGSQSSTFDGVISGTGYLQKEGAGTLTLTGKNTYTATTLVMGGTLATIGANVLPNGNITVNAGGTLLLGGNQEVTSVSGTGLYNLNGYTLKMGGASSMFSGEATGGGILQKDGSGIWSVSGTTTGTTAVLLNGGTIKLMGNDRLSDAGAVTINNGTFDMNGYNDVAGSVTINGGKIINGTLRAVAVAMDNGSVSGVLTGTGGFTKTGGGLVTISSTNTYTGVTAVQGGTLATTGANQLAAGGSVEVGSGGTFKMGGNQTLASVTGAGGINLGNGTLTTGSNSSTFAGTISGNGGLTKTGPGTLTLSGSNSFTGDTVITGGTLVLASSNALASDAVISMGSGSTLQLSGRTVVGAIDQGAGTITGGTLVSSLVATTSGALNSSIADGEGFAAGILKRGGGTTTIGAANTFTGSIKLQGGTLVLDGAGSFDAASRLVMSDGATMDLNGKSQTFSGLSGNGGTVALGSGQLTVSNNTSGLFSGAITGTGSLAKSGNGVMELSGTNGYTGTTMVSGGTLIVAAGGSIASSSIATVGADAHLKVNGAAGAVSVSGTLSGSGTVGAVTLSSGGTLAVGNSPGLLTASSANWNVGSAFQFEIVDALGTAGTDWDLFSVTGQLNLGGISSGNKMLLTILSTDLQNYDVDTEYSWVFAQAASLAGTESWASGLDVTDRFAITSNGFNGGAQPRGGFAVVTGTSEGGLATLSIKAVPEPSSASLLVVGIGGLLALRRRRKS